MKCNYGCATLPPHQQVACGDFLLGGMSAAFFLECDHTIEDFTNATQWQTNIDSGKAFIIKNIKGEIPAASPNMQDNPVGCGPEQIVQGFDNSIHWLDKNVMTENDDVYAAVNGRRLFVGGYNCEEDEIYVSNALANFTAIPRNVPMSNREQQQYDVTGMFYSKVKEIPFQAYTAPSGIFTD
jgi:hypothetical protein